MIAKHLVKYIATLLICCAFVLSGAVSVQAETKSTTKKETEVKATETAKEKSKSKSKTSSTTAPKDRKPVNINKADEEELASLDGIGQERAKKIVEYRKKNGPFKTPEDLMNVSGVGPKTFEKNKEFIKLK